MDKNEKKGFVYIGMSYLLWGFLPLYWKLISSLDSIMIFSYRIIMSLIFVLTILRIKGRIKEFINVMKNKKNIIQLIGASILISLNWYLFIYAVTSGNILQSSMGYYMTPLVMIVIGLVFLKEKVSKYETMAIIPAFVGILIMLFKYGEFPYIALGLALTFSFYGLIKKTTKINYMLSLAWETFIVSPLVIIIIFSGEVSGLGISSLSSLQEIILVLLSGVMTAVPLMFYGKGAPYLSMTSLGFMQFTAPTIQFILAITVGKEVLSTDSLVSFIGIWIGLIIFSTGKIMGLKNNR